MLNFNDGADWLNKRIDGVKRAYKIPEDGGVCVDIGANVGAFAHVNHRRFSKLILIEPAKETFAKCVENSKPYPKTNRKTHCSGYQHKKNT